MSVAQAKAHFSQLVAEAHRGKRTLILRHGKPAAAVVPVTDAVPVKQAKAMTRDEALALLASFSQLGDPYVDAVAELKAGRR
jgi:prevent-host-death family protein